MKIKKDDYLVVKLSEKTNFGCKVLSTGSPVQVIAIKNEHITDMRNIAEIDPKDIIINLGQDPAPGKVYGADFTFLYRGKKEHDQFGRINFFYKPRKEVVTSLMKGFNIVHKTLTKRGLEKVVNDNIVWEVEPYLQSKYAGRYIMHKNPDLPSIIKFAPEAVPASQYPYVILHELAHHLHLKYLVENPRLEARWIQLFNTSIKVLNISKETSLELLNLVLNSETLPSKLRSDLDDDLKLPYQWILRVIGTNHSITPHDLDKLALADMKDEIEKIWPKHSIKKKELAPVISEYACKSVRECFAEAVSFHLTGMKLPGNVVKLVEKSLSYIKGQL